MAQNKTENSLFLKMQEMGQINSLHVFPRSSTWEMVPKKKEKMKIKPQSCCFGKQLQEECRQKTQ